MTDHKKTKNPRIALIGFGYWGPNLLRNLVFHGGFDVVGVVEAKDDARQKCAKSYPYLPLFSAARELLDRVRPEAVVIATPPATHRELAVQCIEAGADVLVEKPMALSVRECDDIIAAAERKGRKVMVDHTFVYHPAIQYMASEIAKGTFGELLYYDSVRINLGGYQKAANVIWDLGPHDLSILDYFLGGKMPESLTSMAAHHFDDTNANLAYCHLKYGGNFVAHLHLNWIAPIKVRTIMLGGTRKMCIYDENLPTEKIKVYDKGIVFNSTGEGLDPRVSYRVGDMIAPAISSQEALAKMISAFHLFITAGEKPPSDGYSGRRIVQILETASKSLAEAGRPIEIPGGKPLRRAA